MPDEKKSNGESAGKNDTNLAKKFGHIEKDDFKKQEKPKKESKEKTIFFDKKETVKEITATEKDSSYSKILSKIKKKTDDSGKSTVASDAKTVSEKTDAEGQIQHLINLATNKNIVYAVRVAKHLEDNYVLDMFHGKLLSDEFHDALVKKGLIK